MFEENVPTIIDNISNTALENIFKEHKRIYIVHIILFCDHGYEFIAEDKCQDKTRNGEDNRIR